MRILIKKENLPKWESYKEIKIIPRIFYKIIKLYYEILGYEVEDIEDEYKWYTLR